MTIIKKPLRACKVEDYNKLRFPLFCSPKIDGIRCVNQDAPMSKVLKPIPNLYINEQFKVLRGLTLDGELILVKGAFNEVQSGIMSRDGKPNFEYWVFDYITDLNMPYIKRCEALGKLALPSFCKKVLPVIVNNLEELYALEENWLSQGFEGVMLRSMNSPYKCGTSTFKEQYLLKMKRMSDSECEVIGFEEQMENTNEKTVDEVGHSVRSSHKAGMVPAGTLGKFLVREIGDTPWKGKEFAIGTGEGLDHALRQKIWDNQSEYLGKVITYNYQKIGSLHLPRLPIWKGFRHRDDISE